MAPSLSRALAYPYDMQSISPTLIAFRHMTTEVRSCVLEPTFLRMRLILFSRNIGHSQMITIIAVFFCGHEKALTLRLIGYRTNVVMTRNVCSGCLSRVRRLLMIQSESSEMLSICLS